MLGRLRDLDLAPVHPDQILPAPLLMIEAPEAAERREVGRREHQHLLVQLLRRRDVAELLFGDHAGPMEDRDDLLLILGRLDLEIVKPQDLVPALLLRREPRERADRVQVGRDQIEDPLIGGRCAPDVVRALLGERTDPIEQEDALIAILDQVDFLLVHRDQLRPGLLLLE